MLLFRKHTVFSFSALFIIININYMYQAFPFVVPMTLLTGSTENFVIIDLISGLG